MTLLVVGPLLELDQRLLHLSPFTRVPPLPAGDFTPVPLLVPALVSAAPGGAGLIARRRRDIPV